MNFLKQLFIAIMLIASTTIQAQSYASMLAKKGTWKVTFCSPKTCNTDFYSSAEDTTIDGKKYRFLIDFHFNKAVVVREDTLQGKVYFRYLYGQRKNTDVLMYDYSLNQNDTINIFNPNSPIPEDSLGPYIVQVVDTLMTEKGPRKRLQLQRIADSSNYFVHTTWLEGVGSLSYINTPSAGPDRFGFGELTCFSFENEEEVYRSDFSKQFNICDTNTRLTQGTTSLAALEKQELSIFPNPFTNEISIHATKEISSIEIYDVYGQIVKEFNEQKQLYKLSELQPGHFYIVIHIAGEEEPLKKALIKL